MKKDIWHGKKTFWKDDVKSTFKDVLFGVVASLAAAFLCYRSIWGLVCGVVVVPYVIHLRQGKRDEKRKERIRTQFQFAIASVSGSLQAGYSAERAWVEAQKELARFYGADAEVTRAFAGMNQKVRMNQPLDEELMGYANETGISEIYDFSVIFRYAKRSGGNMAEIIQRTIKQMNERKEIMDEIEIAVAAKKMEAKMLLLLIPGILLFITLSSADYVSVLYHSPGGRFIMTVCLFVYLLAAFWAMRIVTIKV